MKKILGLLVLVVLMSSCMQMSTSTFSITSEYGIPEESRVERNKWYDSQVDKGNAVDHGAIATEADNRYTVKMTVLKEKVVIGDCSTPNRTLIHQKAQILKDPNLKVILEYVEKRGNTKIPYDQPGRQERINEMALELNIPEPKSEVNSTNYY